MAELKQNTYYTIAPESAINMTGAEFVKLRNLLNSIMQSPVYAEHLAIANNVAAVGMLHSMLDEKLKELIDNGTATISEEQPSNNIPLGKQTVEPVTN